MVRPKTNAERQREYKEKVKLDEEQYDAYKKKKAEQSKVSRQKRKQSQTAEQLDDKRRRDRERQQKCRAKVSKPLKVKLACASGKTVILYREYIQ